MNLTEYLNEKYDDSVIISFHSIPVQLNGGTVNNVCGESHLDSFLVKEDVTIAEANNIAMEANKSHNKLVVLITCIFSDDGGIPTGFPAFSNFRIALGLYAFTNRFPNAKHKSDVYAWYRILKKDNPILPFTIDDNDRREIREKLIKSLIEKRNIWNNINKTKQWSEVNHVNLEYFKSLIDL